MVAGNKMRFHEDQEIYLEMLSSMSTAPSKMSCLCVFQFFPLSSLCLNERCSLTCWQRTQRAVLPSKRSCLWQFEFFVSPPPPSSRGGRWLVDNEVNEHCLLIRWQIKEKFVYPPQREVRFAYSNFPSLLRDPQREVFVDSLTTSSTSSARWLVDK